MYQLKPLSKEGVTGALEKAERYRLLNEPRESESICLDVLEIEPGNRRALVTLLLALTDQFSPGHPDVVRKAREVLSRIDGEYERSYYAGLICERRGKAQYRQASTGSQFVAYDSFREAMDWYEKAEAIRPPGNEDAILRWNTCARILMGDPELAPGPQEPDQEPQLE